MIPASCSARVLSFLYTPGYHSHRRKSIESHTSAKTVPQKIMAPLVPSAKATLSYPLYAVDFDPLDSSRLLVGGGGGAGRTGVGNKIVSEAGSIRLACLRELHLYFFV